MLLLLGASRLSRAALLLLLPLLGAAPLGTAALALWAMARLLAFRLCPSLARWAPI